jgi:predicted DCC family thiol-disulfide oxidoreductase YuxK
MRGDLFICGDISVNTEITDVMKETMFYDGECSLCVGMARRFTPILRARGFRLVAFQEPFAQKRLNLADDACPSEMRLLLTDGRMLGGADAIVQIARSIWWAWPLFLLAQLPGAISLLRALYRWIAARRYCPNGTCQLVPSGRRLIKRL